MSDHSFAKANKQDLHIDLKEIVNHSKVLNENRKIPAKQGRMF